MEEVLDLMLYSYAFLVSGLLIPLIARVFFKSNHSTTALVSMIVGGSVTIAIKEIFNHELMGLDANLFGITAALWVYIISSNLFQNPAKISR